MWTIEFYHPYFGWLDYDCEFASKTVAEDYLDRNPSPYQRRVIWKET